MPLAPAGVASSTPSPHSRRHAGERRKPAHLFYSNAEIDQILGDCSDIGGKKVTVSVAAGRFDACRFDEENRLEDNVLWVGKVPFGIIRYEGRSKVTGVKETTELIEVANVR
jgi:hypothetical protein